MRNKIKKTVVITFTKKGLLLEKKIKKKNAMSLKLFIAVAFYCLFFVSSLFNSRKRDLSNGACPFLFSSIFVTV